MATHPRPPQIKFPVRPLSQRSSVSDPRILSPPRPCPLRALSARTPQRREGAFGPNHYVAARSQDLSEFQFCAAVDARMTVLDIDHFLRHSPWRRGRPAAAARETIKLPSSSTYLLPIREN